MLNFDTGVDLDTEVVVPVDSGPFLNLTTTHTIIILTVRITATSPITDAIIGRNVLTNIVSGGILVAGTVTALEIGITVEVTITVTISVVSVSVFVVCLLM